MGNTSSKDRHDDSVDFGALSPQGIYTGPQDWNRETVGRLIVERKLAPFYRPLEDYEESWDDEQVLAARKEPPPAPLQPGLGGTSTVPGDFHPPVTPSTSHSHRPLSSKSSKAASKEPIRAMSEAKVYRGAVECPICFLYYPPNINYSRCCDQAICTECFVQIKRADPTPTHLESEPACCPYCVRPNFGVVYTPPSWRAGIASDAIVPGRPDVSKLASGNQSGDVTPTRPGKQRRGSVSYLDDSVVTIDLIRPDWEDKLKAVKAAVARRANRRIIMRQVNGRLIPIGVTSGRIQVMQDDEQGASEEGSGHRPRRRPPPELSSLLQSMGGMGVTGQDLDEILLQEAMRLSLLEHEAEQKKLAEEKRKKELAEAKGEGSSRQNEAGPSGASNAAAQSTPAASLRPVSTTSTREPSPASKRLSGVQVSPSPLANASAAIALGIGLPQASGSRSASHSRTPSTSTAHSRTGSSAAGPAFNTLAAAANAANVANAVFVSGAPNPRPSPSPSPAADVPALPVVITQSDLTEDVSAGASSSHETTPDVPLTAVQGVTSTATDIPSPPEDASPRNAVTPTKPIPLPQASTSAAPEIVVNSVVSSQSSTAETDETSTEDDTSAVDYKVLPSTPNLVSADPLISESASIAGRSVTGN